MDPEFLVMALDDFGALQFVLPAPEASAEIQTTIFYNDFCPLIFRLELSYNAIWNKFHNDLAWWAIISCYFSNKKRKRIERIEVYAVFCAVFSFQPIKK